LHCRRVRESSGCGGDLESFGFWFLVFGFWFLVFGFGFGLPTGPAKRT
jgi:hypothetical protein